MGKNSNRIPSLDGIRAISIFLVVLCHYGRDVGWGDPFDLGSLGVRIFFVISGYLITGILMKELERGGKIDLGRFYFRRTLRIFPALYVYLGCMLLLSVAGWADLTLREALPAITYISNYSPELAHNVAHTWSLSTEEQFYLIWPVVLAISGRRNGIYSLVALLVLAPLSSAVLSSKLGYPIPAFFNGPIGIGCLMALIREKAHNLSAYRSFIESQLTIILVPVGIFSLNVPGWHFVASHHALASLLDNVAIVVWLDSAVTNTECFVGRFLNHRWMTVIGVLSYSTYLWQQPFLHLLYKQPSLYLYGPWKAIASPPMRFVMIAACSCLSFFLVEQPFLRLRSRLELKWFVPRERARSVTAQATAGVVS